MTGKLLNVFQIIAATLYIVNCILAYMGSHPVLWWTPIVWAGIVLVYNVFGIEGLLTP